MTGFEDPCIWFWSSPMWHWAMFFIQKHLPAFCTTLNNDQKNSSLQSYTVFWKLFRGMVRIHFKRGSIVGLSMYDGPGPVLHVGTPYWFVCTYPCVVRTTGPSCLSSLSVQTPAITETESQSFYFTDGKKALRNHDFKNSVHMWDLELNWSFLQFSVREHL